MLNKLFSPLAKLIVPPICCSCRKLIEEGEGELCVNCRLDLPYSYDTQNSDNSAHKLLDGLYPIEWAGSLCYYRVGDNYSKMIHNIKYRSQRKIAHYLGAIFGSEMVRDHTFFYNPIDVIVPVPLHRLRRWDRGYNQSEEIANGIAEIIECRVENKAVKRIVNNPNQAHLHGKEERMRNVENIFAVSDGAKLDHRHILIVDDVLTTGSTILSLIEAINNSCEGCRFSVATLARSDRS